MKNEGIPLRQHSDEAWRKRVVKLQSEIAVLKLPDPRLAELIAAAEEACTGLCYASCQWEGEAKYDPFCAKEARLRAALAAFREVQRG